MVDDYYPSCMGNRYQGPVVRVGMVAPKDLLEAPANPPSLLDVLPEVVS